MTISESKRAFYSAFPHIIPPVYRRVTDELLVELHLLTHQRSFKPTAIFAVGLAKIFYSFTKGYKPEKHLESLFNALCKSSGIDPGFIREESKTVLAEIKTTSLNDLETWLKKQGVGAPKKLENELFLLAKDKNHYSRITTIGLMTLIESSKSTENKNKEIIENIMKEASEIYGFSQLRVERDLNLYSSNLDKINQALELMKEAVSQNRKKNEKNTANAS